MARWLDDQEQRTWRSLVASTALLDVALDRQLQRDAGITHAAYAILARLSEADNQTLHMHELAQATNSSQSRLSHAAARLEDQGLIARSRCPDSGRAVHATLTDAGRQLVVDAAPAHVALVRRLIFDRLDSAQVKALEDISRAILDALADEGLSPLAADAPEPEKRAAQPIS